MSPCSVLGLSREAPQRGRHGGAGAGTPGGGGGGAGLASHGRPSHCLHHLGNELVVLSPVPSVWHSCLVLQPRQARGRILPACGATSGPALFAACSLAKEVCSGTYPALVMKAKKQLREKHFQCRPYRLHRALTRKVFWVSLRGPLQCRSPTSVLSPSAPAPTGTLARRRGSEEAGWAQGAAAGFAGARTCSEHPEPRTAAPRRASSTKHPTGLRSIPGHSKNPGAPLA